MAWIRSKQFYTYSFYYFPSRWFSIVKSVRQSRDQQIARFDIFIFVSCCVRLEHLFHTNKIVSQCDFCPFGWNTYEGIGWH